MSVEKVRAYLTPYGVTQRIRELEVSSATVELARRRSGGGPRRIAKTHQLQGGRAAHSGGGRRGRPHR